MVAAVFYIFLSAPASAEIGIKLEAAAWVPALDAVYGWWGAVASGGNPKKPVQQSKADGLLTVAPGTYDVYWVQDYDTSGEPMLLAGGVKVEPGKVTSLRADSGIKIEVADWVPARDGNYGWWGAAPAGAGHKARVNWTKTNGALLLAPGAYDVYWVQDYETSGTPLLVAGGVEVESGKVTTLRADSGIEIEVADWVPARDGNYGWWGAAPAGAGHKARVNWTKTNRALLLAPGAYDVYWVQDYDTSGTPLLLAGGIEVETDKVATVPADSGVEIEVADWVPARDGNYGWWGAAPARAGPKKRVQWTKVKDALLIPPGVYDVYWVQDYDTAGTPLLLASGIKVETGKVATVRADSGIVLKTPSDTPAMDSSYGWWGVTAPGAEAKKRIHWSKGRFDQALLLPPGTYDVHWKQDYDSKPQRRAAGVAVAAGNLTQVELGAPGSAAAAAQGSAKSILTSVEVSSQEAAGFGPDFPLGIRRVDATLAWKDAPDGLRIDIRWSMGGTVVLERHEILKQPEGGGSWYLTMQSGEALPAGDYQVQILENSLALAPPVLFTVGRPAQVPAQAQAEPAQAPKEAGQGGGTAPAAVAGATPGELLVSDDFDDPNSGWRHVQASGVEAGYRDGRYRIAMAATPNLFTIAVQERPAFDDVIVEVEATPEAGSPAHPYGLLARGQDQSNYHAFVIGADGSYAAVHVVNGQPALDSAIDATLPAGTLSSAGQPNRLRLVADGPKLGFYVNDRLVIEIPEAAWLTGHAGFFVSTTGAAPAAVEFDNWRVWSIARNGTVEFAAYVPKDPQSVIKEVALGYADADEVGYDPARSGTLLPHGTSQAVVWLRYDGAISSKKIMARWYLDETVLYEHDYSVEPPNGSVWFGLVNENDRPLPDGNYRVELLENGQSMTAIPFRIEAPAQDAAPWSGRGWTRVADGSYVNQTHGLRLTMPMGWTLGDEMKWPARILWLMSKLGPDGNSRMDVAIIRRKDRQFASARELFDDELPTLKATTIQIGGETKAFSKIIRAGKTSKPDVYEIVQDLTHDGSRSNQFNFVRNGIGYVASFKHKPDATPEEIAELDGVRRSMGF